MGAHISTPVEAVVEPVRSVRRIVEIDHYQGALLGLALGDFVGFLVEGQDAAHCRALASAIVAGISLGS